MSILNVATVEKQQDGSFTLNITPENEKFLRTAAKLKYGKSNKRVNKKRFKKFMLFLLQNTVDKLTLDKTKYEAAHDSKISE